MTSMSDDSQISHERVATKYKCKKYTDHAWEYVHDPDSRPKNYKKCQLCGAIDARNDEDYYYVCDSCGWQEGNYATWCNIGCGSDYRIMHKVPKRHIEKIFNDAYRQQDPWEKNND